MAEEAAPNEPADPTPKKAAESTQAEGETKTVAQKPPARPETKKGAQGKPAPSSEGAQAAAAQPAEPELEGEPGAFGVWLHGALKATPSWLVSLVVHLAIILVLAMLSQSVPAKEDLRELVAGTGELEELDELDELDDEPLEEIDVNTTDVAFESQVEPEEVDIAVADDIQAAACSVPYSGPTHSSGRCII
jgi:hypothetical protein